MGVEPLQRFHIAQDDADHVAAALAHQGGGSQFIQLGIALVAQLGEDAVGHVVAHLHIEVGKQRQQDDQHPAGCQQPNHLAGLAQQHAGNHVRGDQTGRQRQQLEHQVTEDGEGEIQAETLYVPGKFHGILEARLFLFHAAHAESPPFAAVSWPPMSLRYCAESRISCACVPLARMRPPSMMMI